MSKQTVFIVGATGETGGSILDALIEDGSFDITCFIRTVSAAKPSTQGLKDRGLKVVTGDLTSSIENLVKLLQGMDTVISTLFPLDIQQQIPLIDASVQAGVKRFVPCNWGTPVARGGIMELHDLKEEVHDHIFRQRLGFTIIDVGFWHQASFPRVPSGKFDYASFLPLNDVVAGGKTPNMLMDLKDVGGITAKIIKDERTLNKRVYAYGDLLSQNEIHKIIEEKTGEKLELTPLSEEDVKTRLKALTKAAEAEPENLLPKYKMVTYQYYLTKYVRSDNTPENAEYLGYISGIELYPDYKYIKFSNFVDQLIAGNAKRPYPHLPNFGN